eukprot:2883015-Karenia_brevis.AAC.1
MNVVTPKGDDNTLKYKFVHDRAMPLQRKSKNGAGLDIASVENLTFKAHSQSKIRTGIVMATPQGTYARIAPRFGLAARHKLAVDGGVADADYRGEVA